MSEDRQTTRNHNIEILNKLGYRQVANTQVFTNGEGFVLSPAVGEQQDWFDIRKVNLGRMGQKFLLMVRIVPNKFILVKSESLEPLLSQSVMDNRPHSDDVWGLRIKFADSPYLFNVKNSSQRVPVQLLDEKAMREEYQKLYNEH